ncbi:hypothetical protein D9756_009741 [Leucocoprinus leucothites]|uniref:Peptide hydrolase n=1 Tax=Leucocoprinus leucothites TaxID=201217 RepID=A0A8H5CXD0_9AGAR|nr:hypothetical protein D9756_009741 [Leucoagaricus leucothites]
MVFDSIFSLPFYLASILGVHWLGRPLITTEAYQSTISEHNLFRHAENLFAFAQIGGANTRSAGSIGHNATVDYIKSQLDSTGFYDTYLQHFTYTYSVGNATFLVGDTSYDTGYFSYGPAGRASAPLTVVSNFGCVKDDFPVEVAGRIALISRGNCPFSDKVALSGAAGAVGAIIYNNQDGPLGSATLSSATNPLGPYVPAGGIPGRDGKALVAAVQSGQEVIGKLHVIATVENRKTANVVATTKSGDHDNIVALGGHTDSVPQGPGINDNGSGSMAVLELALQLPRFKINNAVRFGFWAGEEFGLLGAKYYAEHLSEEERSKIALYLNFDMLASPNFGYFIYDGDGSAFGVAGPPGSGHIEKTFQDFFKASDLKAVPTKFDGRSDYAPFFNTGIPAGGLLTGAEEIKDGEGVAQWGGEAGVAYDDCYHQACDTLDNLNVTAWVQNTKGAAHAVATYSKSLEGIPRLVEERNPTKGITPVNAPQVV